MSRRDYWLEIMVFAVQNFTSLRVFSLTRNQEEDSSLFQPYYLITQPYSPEASKVRHQKYDLVYDKVVPTFQLQF